MQHQWGPTVSREGAYTATRPEISVVMPCLNEQDAVAGCVKEAWRGIDLAHATGEVIVVDNGSTDDSVALAVAAGARVVKEPVRGYGSAHLRGLTAAAGIYVITADADGAHDLTLIPQFLKRLRHGDDFVIGSRLAGTIDPGAMPPLHRYVGVPVLTWILNQLVGTRLSDAHCGMRGFRRDAIAELHLRSTGMEFASEIVLRAARAGLKISELPVRCRARQGGQSKLRAFADGWRHLRFMMMAALSRSNFKPGTGRKIPALPACGLTACMNPAHRMNTSSAHTGVKRCTLLAQYFPPDMGGASTRCYNVAKGLTMAGWNVVVIAAMPHYPQGLRPKKYRRRLWLHEQKEGMRIVRLWMPPLAHNAIWKRIVLHGSFCVISLFGLFWAKGSSVLFASSPNFFSMFPAFVYKVVLGVAVARNVDDLWPEVFYDLGFLKSPALRRLVDRVSAWTYRIADAVVAISPEYTELIREKYRIAAERLHVVEVGIDTDVFHQMPTQPSGRFVVMYSGLLGRLYDFASLIVAAKALADIRNLQVVIRGTGEQETHVRTLIQEHQTKHVVLDTRFVEPHELNVILNGADVFVLPMVALPASDRGLPAKLFEYQALGKPIVAAASGASARYVRATRSGIVVLPEDPKALATAIRELHGDPARAKAMGMAGLHYVQAELTVARVGQRMSAVFDEARRIRYKAA